MVIGQRLVGLALGLAALVGAAPAQAALFGAPTTISVGASPIRLAVADLNADGKPDVAVPNRGSDSVSILLGNGTASLVVSTTVAVATAPEAIATGDFDKNGTVDLAVSTQIGQVHILLGNGAGGFAQAAGSPFLLGTAVGNTSYGIVVGDLNKDGNLDVAATAHAESHVAVFLGNGTGAFAPAPGSPHRTGAGPMSVVLGDFNGDGTLDLASSSEGTSTVAANNVTVLLGTGTGDFTPAPGSPFAAQNGPTGLAVGDFNEDGKQDLACTHEGAATVVVFAGSGNGAFTQLVTLTAGVRAFGVAVADFDVDGHLDIATADNGPGQTHVFRGTGTGAFTNVVGSPFTVATGPAGIVAADLDLDLAPDLLFGNVGSGTITILLNETQVVVPVDAGTDAGTDAAADAGDADAGLTDSDASPSDAGFDGGAALPDGASGGTDSGAAGADATTADAASEFKDAGGTGDAGGMGDAGGPGGPSPADGGCTMGATPEDALAPIAFTIVALAVARRRKRSGRAF